MRPVERRQDEAWNCRLKGLELLVEPMVNEYCKGFKVPLGGERRSVLLSHAVR